MVYSAEFAGDLITFLTQAKSAGLTGKPDSPKLFGLFDVDTLRTLGATAPTGAYAYGRAPFFAIKTSQMDQFVKDFKDRYNIPPSDWAVMAYDAFTAWAEGVKKANSFDGDKVSKAMSGLSFASTRGTVTLRTVDHHANVSEYEGVLQTDAPRASHPLANAVSAPPNDILVTPLPAMAARSAVSTLT